MLGGEFVFPCIEILKELQLLDFVWRVGLRTAKWDRVDLVEEQGQVADQQETFVSQGAIQTKKGRQAIKIVPFKECDMEDTDDGWGED